MKFYNLLFIAFFVFILAHTVQGVPFVISTNTGISIENPSIDTIMQGADHEFHFHTFNSTSGLVFINNSAQPSCQFHMYDQTGEQFYTDNNVGREGLYDYVINVTGGNFSTAGLYAFVFQCNYTTIGGFYQEPFQVTPNGENPSTAQALFYIGLILFILFFLCLMFLAHLGDKSELSRFWWFAFMWIPIWAVLFIAWNMARSFLISQGAIQSILFYGWFIIGLLYPFFLLGLVLYTFYWIYKQREVQRLLTRGFSLDDANAKVHGRGYG